jgi:hypothetical protein
MKPAISAIFSFHSFFSNKFTWRRVWGFSAAGGGIEAASQPASQSDSQSVSQNYTLSEACKRKAKSQMEV